MKQYPRVGIGILILNKDQLLLGKRTAGHNAGTWQSCGGNLEFGESFEECVIREISEEIGISVKNIKHLTVTNDIFRKENKHYVTIFFTCEYDYGEIRSLESEKCSEWKWFKLNALPDNLFLPYNKILHLRKLSDH